MHFVNSEKSFLADLCQPNRAHITTSTSFITLSNALRIRAGATTAPNVVRRVLFDIYMISPPNALVQYAWNISFNGSYVLTSWYRVLGIYLVQGSSAIGITEVWSITILFAGFYGKPTIKYLHAGKTCLFGIYAYDYLCRVSLFFIIIITIIVVIFMMLLISPVPAINRMQ